jgi:chromosome segregation ATPase
MKILYIANERRDAHLASRALRSISPGFKVLWASNIERAAFWILEYSDVAALIVEVRSDSAGCWYLKRARELGLKAPVIVVVPDGVGSPAESLKAGVDSYVAKNQSFSCELPVVLARAIERAQTSPVVRRDHLPSGAGGESAAGAPADRQSHGSVSKTQQHVNGPVVAHGPTQSKIGVGDGFVSFVSAAGNKPVLERRISELETMFHQREQAWMAERAAVVERQEVLEELLHQEQSMRTGFEQKLADAKAALEDAERRQSAAISASETLTERHLQYEVGMTRVASTWDMVDEQLRQWALEVERARQSLASSAVTEVARLTEREAELTSQLAEAAATQRSLEGRLADAESSLRTANERGSHDRRVAAEQAAEQQAAFQAQLEREVESRRNLEDDLARARIARDDAEKRHQSAVTAAAALRTEFDAERARAAEARETLGREAGDLEAALNEARQTLKSSAATLARLTEREAELTSRLAEAAATQRSLEGQLADAAAAMTGTDERAARDRRAAAQQAAEREAELEGLIQQERATRADVEQQLAQVEAARREAERQHASAMTTAATTLAERQAQFEVDLSQMAAARDDFKRQVNVAETALLAARHDHATAATEVERLTQREAQLAALLTEAAATRRSLEGQLADAATAMTEADERATRDRLAAAQQAAEREAGLESLIQQERATRADVEQQLAQVEAARREAERLHASDMTTAATTLAERQAQFEVELSQTAAARDDFKRQVNVAETALAAARHDHATAATEVERLTGREAELTAQLAEAAATRHSLEGQLADVATAMTEADARARAEVSRLENRIAQEREELAATRDQSRQREIQYQEEREGLERARLAAEAESDARIREQAAEIERLQGSLSMTTQELTGARRRCEILQTEADRVTPLRRQLDESRVEIRRQFQQCPLALWRCTGDGVLTHANRALWDLVGCGKHDELHAADFAKTVFESPQDLAWLIERCSSTNTPQSVETAWKRRDGKRFVVRLSAVESAPDEIEIAVEDVTTLRVLEHKLDQAHRLEAVGRVASETAVTCGKLLRDVHNDGQQFLKAVSGDPPLRQRGEMLLDEVVRAAGYLQRLAAYGDEQSNALKPVDLGRVLRDLKPVLKRVAGDDVELEVSKISSPLNVDMKAERVERLFVNLAGYGRERMAFGGQLRIELATVVVDQEFIAQYPNVRPGPHALITVTEVRRAMPEEGSLSLRNGATESTYGVAAEKPGVDLGALQDLIQECGGHLWMTVEPPGNMVVKIRLPLRVWDDPTQQTTPGTPSSRGGVMARWFRH